MSSVRRKRRTPEQIIAHLREADGMLSAGQTVGQVCQKLSISEQTYHRWRNHFGGMKADGMKRLKKLEEENRRLKKMYADAQLSADLLKEALSKKW